MPTQVTGNGLLSLIKDFGSDAPKSQLVAAAGYIKPDGKLSWTAFYEALLAARNIPIVVSKEEDNEYEELSEDAKDLYDEIHSTIGEKWSHCEIMEMLDKMQDLGIETADQFTDALVFVSDDPWDWQRDFISDLMESLGTDIPSWVAVDYEHTWDSALQYDYNEIEFDGSVFIFNRNY